MQKAKYTAEFKEEAVRQVIDRGHSVVDVAKRLGIGDGLLYTWVKKFKAANEPVAIDDMKSMQAELNRLKAELRRTTEERDILKKAAAYFATQRWLSFSRPSLRSYRSRQEGSLRRALTLGHVT